MTNYLSIGEEEPQVAAVGSEFTSLSPAALKSGSNKPDILNEAIKCMAEEFPDMAVSSTTSSQDFPDAVLTEEPVIVLTQPQPQPQPLQQQPQPQHLQPSAGSTDLYTLTLTDGSVVQLRVQPDPVTGALMGGANNSQELAAAGTEWLPAATTVVQNCAIIGGEETVPSPIEAATEITVPFHTPPPSTSSSPTSSSLAATPPFAITGFSNPPPQLLSPIYSPQADTVETQRPQQEQNILLLASPPSPQHQERKCLNKVIVFQIITSLIAGGVSP